MKRLLKLAWERVVAKPGKLKFTRKRITVTLGKWMYVMPASTTPPRKEKKAQGRLAAK